MSAAILGAKMLEFMSVVQQFNGWDSESDRPKMAEVEFDATWKLVIVWEDGFQTIKIHRRIDEK